MKKINLLIIDNIFMSNPELLSDNIIKNYLGINEIQKDELETLNRLCTFFKNNLFHHSFFTNYYINYKIAQIEKEFDLLRIGKKTVLNIELKSEDIDKLKILKELEKNYYYLSFLNKSIHCYAFIKDGNKDVLYYYDASKGSLETVTTITNLFNTIKNIEDIDDDNIDKLFNPSNYLVSPFSKTKKFIESNYFLTNHQDKIKVEITEEIYNKSSNKIFSIAGAAGTGKTLLTYDIAKSLLLKGKKFTIIHCAQTNDGIDELTRKYDWDIISISSYRTADLSLSEVLIIDEAQRLSLPQLERIVEDNKEKYILFAHDMHQKLNRTNDAKLVVEKIENSMSFKNYKLKNKIRHSSKLASFINKFYDLNTIKSDTLLKKDYEDISFYFTENTTDANFHIEYLKNLGWEHIYLTNNTYNHEAVRFVEFSSRTNFHEVIGQEYDNVVITIDEHFYYTNQDKLCYGQKAYDNPLDSLFQAITRTRKKLNFVIVNNEDVYEKCVQIVNRG